MSRPYLEPPPPPPPPPLQGFVIQGGSDATTTATPHGSVGAVIGVLVMVVILSVVAVVIGRLCSGKTILGFGHFDMESWAETKCSSCIDGRITSNVAFPRPNVSPETTSPPQQQQSETQKSTNE